MLLTARRENFYLFIIFSSLQIIYEKRGEIIRALNEYYFIYIKILFLTFNIWVCYFSKN